MTTILPTIGWICIALDVVAALFLAANRTGDAATRGIGPGLGAALGALAVVAALCVWFGRSGERVFLTAAGVVLAAAPVALTVFLTVSRNGIALIYPSMRNIRGSTGEPVRYEFPDPVTYETAIAMVMQDHDKVAALVNGTPKPDLAARDERGNTLLGIATKAAVVYGGTLRDVDGLRLLLAAGARPTENDCGVDGGVMDQVVTEQNERQPIALELLLDAGLDPSTALFDGRPALYHDHLSPAAARILLARGADKNAIMRSGGRDDWSAVTYQASLRRRATALALLEGGVPRDHGRPPGAVLERVIANVADDTSDEERATPAFQAFMAALER